MSLEADPGPEKAMHDLDFYILVGYCDGYPVTRMAGSPWTWNPREVRCYTKIGTARSMRTRALNVAATGSKRTSRYYPTANADLLDIRILHVHLNLVTGESTTEWVK